MKTLVTNSAKGTKKLGELLAKKLRGREIIALVGELGSGKTTFAQGLLKGLGIKGPITSPTFTIIKHYHITCNMKHKTKKRKMFRASCFMFHNVYHVDAYRVTARDILTLGWEEIISEKNSIIIIEWADRIRKIIPEKAIWVKFQWLGKDLREIKLLKRKSN